MAWSPSDRVWTRSVLSPEASGMRQSTLATLLEGSGRLWIFGGALVSIFLGLLLGTPTPRAGADDELNGLEPAA